MQLKAGYTNEGRTVNEEKSLNFVRGMQVAFRCTLRGGFERSMELCVCVCVSERNVCNTIPILNICTHKLRHSHNSLANDIKTTNSSKILLTL